MTRAAAVALLLTLCACGAAPPRVGALDELERVRAGAAVAALHEGGQVAPEPFARAEQERGYALEAQAAGDELGARLHAERAVAAYQRALVVARLARATTELSDAQKALDDTTTQAQTVDASRASLERDVQELEGRLKVARERLLPAASAPAAAEREAARVVAARAMGVEARLLCDATALVAPGAAGLDDAAAELAKVEARLARPPPAPIDDAARARARCLDVLTRARRAAGQDASAADALQAELSAAGGWDPGRDERGVVVTLHDAFRGASLAPEMGKRLEELGRIAGAHPAFALQVVVHDAQAPAASDATDGKRADAVARALVAGGAAAGKLKTELAGARAPVVDPADAKLRPRNERLDVVFVAGGK